MKRVLTACIVVALTASCGPKPRIPFDPGAVPAGQGWHCFAHHAPGLVDLGSCSRSEAACQVEKADGGSDSDKCEPQSPAYCIYIDPSKPMCFPRRASCDEYVRQYGAAYKLSECREVP